MVKRRTNFKTQEFRPSYQGGGGGGGGGTFIFKVSTCYELFIF